MDLSYTRPEDSSVNSEEDSKEFDDISLGNKELLEKLTITNNFISKDAFKLLTQLNERLIRTRKRKNRPKLGIEYIELFPKCWSGLNTEFEVQQKKKNKNLMGYTLTDEATDISNLEKKYFYVLNYFVEGTDYSYEACRAFGEQGYLELLLSNLQRGVLSKRSVIDSISIMYNCCRNIPENRELCRTGIALLENLSKSSDPRTQATAFLALSYIVNKTEIHKLSLNESCIDFLIGCLADALKSPDRLCIFWAGELAQGIYQLAINDYNKELIANKNGITLLERILTEDVSTEEEKCFAAQAIWQMAFSDANKKEMRKKENLIEALNFQKKNGTNHDLRDACSGALFVINDIDKPIDANKRSPTNEVVRLQFKSDGHIMISYQHKSQALMMKLKAFLQTEGYNVWMDVDKMRGDILDAMARAVQQSAVVLICMTEPFKESQHCRTEATYAYTLKKDIIPLLLEDGFVPGDWLGALLGMKKYFPMYSEEQLGVNLPELIKELGDRGKSQESMMLPPSPVQAVLMQSEQSKPTVVEEADSGKPNPHSHGAVRQTPKPNPKPELLKSQTRGRCTPGVKTWNTHQVQGWVKASGIRTNERLEQLNGEDLTKIYNSLCLAPEYCTTSLKTEFGLGMLDVITFVEALKALLE